MTQPAMQPRRSQRQLNQQMRRVLKDGTTDVGEGILSMMLLGRQLEQLMYMLDEVVNMDSSSSFGPFHSMLTNLEEAHGLFVTAYPGMLSIRQCKDLHGMVLSRIYQCRSLLATAEQLPAPTLSSVCLPAHAPEAGSACAICCDTDGPDWVKLPCGHAFHRDCVVKWLTDYKAQCPMCRQSIT